MLPAVKMISQQQGGGKRDKGGKRRKRQQVRNLVSSGQKGKRTDGRNPCPVLKMASFEFCIGRRANKKELSWGGDPKKDDSRTAVRLGKKKK